MAQEARNLMAGEDPLSVHIDDAEHWVAVYTELVAMARSIQPPPSQAAVSPSAGAASEIAFIQERLASLEQRLEFWRQRVGQIKALG